MKSFASLIFLFMLLGMTGQLTAQNIYIPSPIGGIHSGSRPLDILTNVAQYGVNLGYDAVSRQVRKSKSLKNRVKEANQACVYQLDRLAKNDSIVNNMLRIEYSRIAGKFGADGRNRRNPYIVESYINDLNRLGTLATRFNTTCQTIQSLQSLYPSYRQALSAEYAAYVSNMVITQPDFSSNEVCTIVGTDIEAIRTNTRTVLTPKTSTPSNAVRPANKI